MSREKLRGLQCLGFTVGITTLALTLMGSDCRPPWSITDGDCTPGLMLQGVYQIRLVDRYREGAPFDLTRIPDLHGRPSCDGFDALDVGSTFRVRMTSRDRELETGCGFYTATVLSGIDGVDFSDPLRHGGHETFAIEVPNYTLLAQADRPAPFVDTPAVLGQRPPLRITRTAMGCTDVFVAEIFQIRDIDGGMSVDAR